MSAPTRHSRRLPTACLAQTGVRCAAERGTPLLAEILAFWALWHCRHARPPDLAPAEF